MKIFDFSEKKQRGHRVDWDVLLAPHHCSKKVMYVGDGNGGDALQTDVLDAFTRHGGQQPVVVASSGVIPQTDTAGANPPHRMAADRYEDLAQELICTMVWPDADAPAPVVFAVDADGARIVRDDTIALSAGESVEAMRASGGRRLAVVAAAAAAVGNEVAEWRAEAPRAATAGPTGPERVRAAPTADRGGDKAPGTTVGFGRTRGHGW